jgi:hypothetical protein
MAEAQAGGEVERYLVRAVRGGWLVTRGDEDLDTFPASEAAVTEACRAARQTAVDGRVGLVVVETAPQELHCFMPRPRTTAPPPPLPGYLRLITPNA